MTRLNADVLTTRVADGIAVITLGSAKRIYMERAEDVKRAINTAQGHALNLTHWAARFAMRVLRTITLLQDPK